MPGRVREPAQTAQKRTCALQAAEGLLENVHDPRIGGGSVDRLPHHPHPHSLQTARSLSPAKLSPCIKVEFV